MDTADLKYDVAIIGGGASGLMAAALAADNGRKIILIEKNEVCGKKLLITGKGRCNITNARQWEDFHPHIHPDPSFFKYSFMNFSNTDTIDFFHSIGVPTVCERGERIYPESGKSSDVRDALVKRIKQSHNVTIATGTEVTSVRKEENVYVLNTLQRKNIYSLKTLYAYRIIIATGGLSYPLTGSTGDGYGFARQFGHSIAHTHPSLTALVPAENCIGLSGLTLKNVNLSLFVDGGMVQSEFGEITFTSGGLEGALGFRVSRNAVSAIEAGKHVEVAIDLKPALSAGQLKERIQREYNAGIKLDRFLDKFLPIQAVSPFINTSRGVNINNLPVKLKNWRFKIKGYVDYSRAVITAGGVSLKEVSRKTMESQLSPGMYFTGEVLNLDADTGGYNLQIAFSTAASAIKAACQ